MAYVVLCCLNQALWAMIICTDRTIQSAAHKGAIHKHHVLTGVPNMQSVVRYCTKTVCCTADNCLSNLIHNYMTNIQTTHACQGCHSKHPSSGNTNTLHRPFDDFPSTVQAQATLLRNIVPQTVISGAPQGCVAVVQARLS